MKRNLDSLDFVLLFSLVALLTSFFLLFRKGWQKYHEGHEEPPIEAVQIKLSKGEYRIKAAYPAPKLPALPPQADAASGVRIPITLDWQTLQTNNLGGLIDLNGDGVMDFVIFQGDTLLWKNAQQGKLVPLLRLTNASIVAYTIRSGYSAVRPSLVYFTDEHTGYLRQNLGTNEEGTPFFGDAEDVK